jgi:hypothetical protein
MASFTGSGCGADFCCDGGVRNGSDDEGAT